MKDLARRTAYDKFIYNFNIKCFMTYIFIRHKAINVEKNSLYDGYQQGLA